MEKNSKKYFLKITFMQLRPRINSLEKNESYDLSGVPNTKSSGIFKTQSNAFIQLKQNVTQLSFLLI
jgi:hypothetical protein